MSERHVRGHPECKEKSEVKRMPNQAVREGSPECDLRVGVAHQWKPHLTQTEEIEMVDEEGHHQNGNPANGEQGPKRRADGVVLGAPNLDPYWTPSPEQ